MNRRFSKIEWQDLAAAFAFLGNSLLKPMSQGEPVGLNSVFWQNFPDFESHEVALAVNQCSDYVCRSITDSDKANFYDSSISVAIRSVSAEFTRLFVGPPKPLAAPWETLHLASGASVGFGQPTFDMQDLLRCHNLEIHNKNNQYADHIGIELLFLSVLCRDVADVVDTKDFAAAEMKVQEYVATHPARWVASLADAVAHAEPEGYFICLLNLTTALLNLFHMSDQ
ncbi:molecular chaperone TorD family protein [Cryptobacterium curtum]|uniref:TorD/DmsD family molecular chaperone n=1 Tax=Cryptobacterium curtum TaxID=84163 RepID=UPI0028D76593|nr:molecular chaperone TorD family protein [Cryptobacterium curtum]